MAKNDKIIIYQLLPRLFGNKTPHCVPNGTIDQNGSGKLNDINEKALKSLKALGATHVWYTGIIEHANKTDYSGHGIKPCNPHVVKGNAGSPYAITDYYDIDPDIAVDVNRRQEEFDSLVARTHAAGMGVIIDFVPNHVAREYHSDAMPAGVSDLGDGDDSTKAFDRDNNFYYLPGQAFVPHVDMGEGTGRYEENPARATGNDCFHASPDVNDWYENVKLNYGSDYCGGTGCHFDPIPDTWCKMLDILLYWARRGVDAFRCDMAHMVPVEFWKWAIAQVKAVSPNVFFIAELYDTSIYHRYVFEGGFDYLYNKVTLYDTLFAITRGHAPASDITRCWQSLPDLDGHMLNFLENHDEVRLASPQFAGDAYKGLPALVVSAAMSRAPFMLYMGQELGEPALDAEGFSGPDGRTTIFDYWALDTLRRWNHDGAFDTRRLTAEEKALRNYYKKVLTLCRSEAALTSGDFFDLMYVNGDTLNTWHQYAFLRHTKGTLFVIATNFCDEPANASLRLPQHAFDLYGIAPVTVEAREMLTCESKTCRLASDTPFDIEMPAWGACLWKIKIPNTNYLI
ncbi:MAG: alpha-amylase family protein [Muribaculaceae bacterium]|nr:alpha-amylase family protein [Muribaculaceae bacterium]